MRYIISLVITLMTLPAHAMSCAKYDEMVKWLDETQHEQSIGFGMSDRGTIAELFVSKDSDTWTIVQVLPDGQSCIVDFGGDWMLRLKPIPGRDS